MKTGKYSVARSKESPLPLIKHKAIHEIENEGMDEGRFFVWLKPGWSWEATEQKAGRSFESKKEAKEALKHIYKTESSIN